MGCAACKKLRNERDHLARALAGLREYVKAFGARGKRMDGERDRCHGCVCPHPEQDAAGNFAWKIDPECRYHAEAFRYPSDHSIPWNCPTYWDGCNCREEFKRRHEAQDVAK